jgi:glycerophosphoryl diester phosphodiesterase
MRTFTQPGRATTLRCVVTGHRGAAAVCPENTLPSLQTARDVGAEMIEFDVQQSADDELIVFHDETLQRLCGDDRSVSSLTAAELATMAVGQWHGQPVTIPSLPQVFSTLGQSILYNVELKTDTIHYPGIEARLASIVRAHGLTDHVLVSSFHHESLRLVRQCDPHLSLGLLLDRAQAQQCGGPDGIVNCARAFSCFSVHPEFRTIRQWPELVTVCHAAGLHVLPWTVDDQDDWQFLVEEMGVDGIITNDPGRLYEWLLPRSQVSR